MDLEQTAIERLRMASEMSLRLYEQPIVVTYSGGKDSDVLLHLAGAAGIPYEVLHSLTTADAPETVWHVRETFRRLELAGVPCDIDKHKQPDGTYMTMWRLIPLKLVPPTRIWRYCCAALKETSGRGRWIATGVRWAESQKRKSRGVMEALHRDKSKRLTLMNDNDESRMLIENCQLKGTRTVNPIIDWPTESIWDYCAAEDLYESALRLRRRSRGLHQLPDGGQAPEGAARALPRIPECLHPGLCPDDRGAPQPRPAVRLADRRRRPALESGGRRAAGTNGS